MGFSPNAHFMATSALTSMFSTRTPQGLIAAKVPPSTLALPGPTHMQVTPASRASFSAKSMG